MAFHVTTLLLFFYKRSQLYFLKILNQEHMYRPYFQPWNTEGVYVLYNHV